MVNVVAVFWLPLPCTGKTVKIFWPENNTAQMVTGGSDQSLNGVLLKTDDSYIQMASNIGLKRKKSEICPLMSSAAYFLLTQQMIVKLQEKS